MYAPRIRVQLIVGDREFYTKPADSNKSKELEIRQEVEVISVPKKRGLIDSVINYLPGCSAKIPKDYNQILEVKTIE